MIAIIGAMDEEVNELISLIDKPETHKAAGSVFYSGRISGNDVVITCCGVGKVNAAMITQLLIDRYQVKKLIQTGVAGALSSNLKKGDVVLSKDALYHDVDATRFGYRVGQVPRMNTFSFKADDRLLNTAISCCREVLSGENFHVGRIVSGDQFISDKKKKDWIKETFGGACTEMEGAAVAHVCYLNSVPFLIIRAISDNADSDADSDYSGFKERAIRNNVTLINAILKRHL